MENNKSQAKLLAGALYEIRVQLADHLGRENRGDPAARAAAHLAYALHNEALAILEGRTFDEDAAISKIKALDTMFGENFIVRLAQSGAIKDV